MAPPGKKVWKRPPPNHLSDIQLILTNLLLYASSRVRLLNRWYSLNTNRRRVMINSQYNETWIYRWLEHVPLLKQRVGRCLSLGKVRFHSIEIICLHLWEEKTKTKKKRNVVLYMLKIEVIYFKNSEKWYCGCVVVVIPDYGTEK